MRYANLLPLFVILFFLALSPKTAITQPAIHVAPNIEEGDTLRVGLALSGGGAKGIAHIGILKAIEDAGLRIDYITGTSMGSLVGGLYAIGYTSDQLIELAKNNNFVDLFTERVNRRHISNYEKLFDGRTIATFPINERGINLPAGIITGQNIYAYLTRHTWPAHHTENFDDFLIPYATIGTDIETGDAKVFRSGYLADAIRASISIPSAMYPHRIGDRYYVDGGLARNLPVQDAFDMGANFVIAVDVSTPLLPQEQLRSLTEIMNQAVLYRINERTDEQKALADLAITISRLDDYNMMDFDQAALFIDFGLEKGAEYLDHFKEIAALQSTPAVLRAELPPPSPLPINDVLIEGNTLFDDDFIIRLLDFESGTSLSPELIEEKISRLHSSQYIQQVTYRIVPDDDYYYNLKITVVENKSNDFKVGLRYETQTQASILAEATFQDLLHTGSINRFDLRLGDDISFNSDYIYYGALGSSLAALTSFQFHSEKVDGFVDGDLTSSFTNRIIRGEMSVGNYFSNINLFSVGVRKDFIYQADRINIENIEPSSDDYLSFFARYLLDKVNRNSYPTNGQKLFLEAHHSNSSILSPILFTSLRGYFEGHFAVTDEFTVRTTAYAGYSYGNDLPWSYWSVPNRYERPYGSLHFGGFSRYEISSRNMQIGSFGFQVEPIYHRFIGMDIFAGRFMDDWNISLLRDDIEYGASITVGALTILGPVQAIFSTSTRNSFKAELQLGYRF